MSNCVVNFDILALVVSEILGGPKFTLESPMPPCTPPSGNFFVTEASTLYTSLFAQNEQHIKKQTIKKQQQTTKQTGINTALTKISYHMTC